MVEQTLPTLSQIKKAIPEKCFQVSKEEGEGGNGWNMHMLATCLASSIQSFLHRTHKPSLPPLLLPLPPLHQKSLLRSVYYMLRDFAALAALYLIYPTVQAKYGLPGLFVWWNLAGKQRWREAGRMEGTVFVLY